MARPSPFWRLWFVATLAVASSACAEATSPADGGVWIPDAQTETSTSTPKTKIVLLAGPPSHGPREHEYTAGSILLASFLVQHLNVSPIVVRNAWPDDLTVFDDAQAIIFFTDGNANHPLLVSGRLDALAPHVERGVGLGSIHWSVHFPGDPDPRVLDWWGAHYSDAISVNPHWTARFDALPEHALTRGVDPFEIRDEWYYNLAFAQDAARAQRITPILQAVPPDETRFTQDAASHPGRAETVMWTYERADGGRSFGFTGAHFHDNWADERFRKVVVNAVLWIAGVEPPADGARVGLDPADLDLNLDPK